MGAAHEINFHEINSREGNYYTINFSCGQLHAKSTCSESTGKEINSTIEINSDQLHAMDHRSGGLLRNRMTHLTFAPLGLVYTSLNRFGTFSTCPALFYQVCNNHMYMFTVLHLCILFCTGVHNPYPAVWAHLPNGLLLAARQGQAHLQQSATAPQRCCHDHGYHL